MKSRTTSAAYLFCAAFALVHPMLALACFLAIFTLTLRPMPQMCEATLILSILTGKVIEAFKTKTPALSFFSIDWGKTGDSFAQPVKFDQEVISQMAIPPTVSDYTPGDALSTGAQNVKDLLVDVKVKINRCKKVVIKIPAADAVKLLLDGAFQSAIMEGAMALGRAVVTDVLTDTIAQNFSQEIVETVANADKDTLNTARMALNAHGALTPRYVLGSSTFINNIANDPRVTSGDYFGQRTEADPYVVLTNIEGFTEVREMVGFPANTSAVGAFTVVAATDIVTLAAHGLNNGDRVRLTTVTTLPAGLALATDYWVRDVTTDTFKLAATNGGAAINITDVGVGVHTLSRYEDLNAFAFEKRAIHIAFRPMMDSIEMAKKLGIPITILTQSETDLDTGITFTSFMWMDGLDIYCAFVVMYGHRGGRELSGSTSPGTEVAGTALDYAGVRIVGTANNA